MKGRHFIKNQQGFTLIEIIAVLILLGILAAVAVPKYMDLTVEARNKAAFGQIAEVKGRLSLTLADYMLKNDGDKPATGTILVTAANTLKANSCRLVADVATAEGDFNFYCTGNADQTVTISVTKVQTKVLKNAAGVDTPVTGTYTFSD